MLVVMLRVGGTGVVGELGAFFSCFGLSLSAESWSSLDRFLSLGGVSIFSSTFCWMISPRPWLSESSDWDFIGAIGCWLVLRLCAYLIFFLEGGGKKKKDA